MKIAITGGIGSGKSFVCRELAKRGIEVYDCDAAAKRLMRSDEQLQAALKLLVGNEVYADGVLQKPVLAQFLLASETNKLAVMMWFILLWLAISNRAERTGWKAPFSLTVVLFIAPVSTMWSA